MGKLNRFSINKRSKISNKYVLYVEDLFVSFKGNTVKQEIDEKILRLSEEKRLSDTSNSRKKEIDEMIENLTLKQKDFFLKEELKELKSNYKNDLVVVKRAFEEKESVLYGEFSDSKEFKKLELLKTKKPSKEDSVKFEAWREKIKIAQGNLNIWGYDGKLVDLKRERKEELSSLRQDYKFSVSLVKKQFIKNHYGVNEVLKGLSFGLREGETLALIGANGAGKTVLIETILGMYDFDSCEMLMLNLGMDSFQKNKREIGIQYQQSKMPSSKKVRVLIDDFKNLYKGRVIEKDLDDMLDVFGINPFIDKKVESLSGGQKQRLNLLFAVIHQPKLMILDEFITGLDVKSVKSIINYINELKIKNGASLLIVSHQPEEIEALADRVLVLKDGRVQKETYVEDIIKEYGSVSDFVEGII